MKCRVCGREMLDRGAYYECSNILCDYEEDVKSRAEAARKADGLPGVFLLKATISTRTVSSEIYVVR